MPGIDPVTVAARTAGPVFKIPALPMAAVQAAAPDTVGVPAQAFYVLARGGALGDVGPETIAAAFVWMEPGRVARAWEKARATTTLAGAVRHWQSEIWSWGRENLPAGPSLDRLDGLLARCVRAASPAGAPIFAGWRAGATPPDHPGARVIHNLYALRELRGALHGCAVLAAGVSPREAVSIRTPWIATLFGWPEPAPEPERIPDWEAAERATDVAMAPAFAGLSAAESETLIQDLDRLLAYTGALWTDDGSGPTTVARPVAPVRD